MFTFGLMYIFFYLYIFISLLILSFLFLPLKMITHISLTNYLILIQKYTVFKNIFFFLIFMLSGLPPVGLFFIKFNILVYLLYQLHFFYILILFIIFFLNMLYYIQIFNIRNFKKNIYPLFSSNIETYWNTKNNTNCYQNNYNYIYYINLFLTLSILTIFFFTDLYFIFSL